MLNVTGVSEVGGGLVGYDGGIPKDRLDASLRWHDGMALA